SFNLPVAPLLMSDLISVDVLSTLAQVVMIDLVLAGDNAVVIGLAAAGLPDKQRKRAILIGIVTATVLRTVGATVKRTLRGVSPMSALPPKVDIAERNCHVCFVPKADIAAFSAYTN